MFSRRRFEFMIDEDEEVKDQDQSEDTKLNIKGNDIQKKKKAETPAEKLNLTPSKVDFKFSFFAKK
jgi:hypothetical protein